MKGLVHRFVHITQSQVWVGGGASETVCGREAAIEPTGTYLRRVPEAPPPIQAGSISAPTGQNDEQGQMKGIIMKRMHIHIGVENLDDSINFYSALFGTKPVKTKDQPDCCVPSEKTTGCCG